MEESQAFNPHDFGQMDMAKLIKFLSHACLLASMQIPTLILCDIQCKNYVHMKVLHRYEKNK